MIELIKNANIAIIGGGKFCRTFLQFMDDGEFCFEKPAVLGVADSNKQAVGLQFARENNIFTTDRYENLFTLAGLQVLIELTNDNAISAIIEAKKPPDVILIDHVAVRSLWDALQIEKEKQKSLQAIKQTELNTAGIENLIEEFAGRINTILAERNQRYEKIENELVASERAMAQIVNGSTIPTFVIDRNHVVTH